VAALVVASVNGGSGGGGPYKNDEGACHTFKVIPLK